MLKKIIKFFTRWNELLTIPLALVLWYFSPSLLLMLDPTAATYDAGIFQIILFTIIQFFFYTGITWLYLKMSFPNVYKYLDDSLDLKNNEMSKWEKSKIVLWLFSLLLLALVFLARVI